MLAGLVVLTSVGTLASCETNAGNPDDNEEDTGNENQNPGEEEQEDEELGLKFSNIANVKKNAYETVTVTPELKLDGSILTQDNKLEDSTLVFGYEIQQAETTLPTWLSFSPQTGVLTGSYQHDLPPLPLKITGSYTPVGEEPIEVESNEFTIEVDALDYAGQINNLTFKYNSNITPTPNLKQTLRFQEQPLPINANVSFSFYGNQPALNGLQLNSLTGQITGKLELDQLPANPFPCLIQASYVTPDHTYVVMSNPFTITIVPNDGVTVATSGEEVENQNLKTAYSVNIHLPTVTSVTRDEDSTDVTNECDVIYTLTPSLPDGLEFSSVNHTITGTARATSTSKQYTYTTTINGKYSSQTEVKFNLGVENSVFDSWMENNGSPLPTGEITVGVNDQANQLSIKPIAAFNGELVNQNNLTMVLDSSSDALPTGVSIANNAITGYPTERVPGLQEEYVIEVIVGYTVNGVSFSENRTFILKVVNTLEAVYGIEGQHNTVKKGETTTIPLTSFVFNNVEKVQNLFEFIFASVWVEGLNSEVQVGHYGSSCSVDNLTLSIKIDENAATGNTIWYLKVQVNARGQATTLATIWIAVLLNIVDADPSEGNGGE